MESEKLIEIYNSYKNFSIEELNKVLNQTTRKGFDKKMTENVINKLLTFKLKKEYIMVNK